MQNRYAGDVGDFGKLALLRAFAGQMKVGVNWYLVKIPGENTNDGRHTGYLDHLQSPLCQCDTFLAHELKKIVHSNRSILQLQRLLPGITCYRALLERKKREQWHQDALSTLKFCDLVFLDPDNGLLVPSVKKGAPRSIKYLYDDEIVDYYGGGHSLFFYNHRSREPVQKYFGRFYQLLGRPAFKDAIKFALTYSAYAVRDFFFIIQPRHSRIVSSVTASFMNSRWNDFFKYLSPGFLLSRAGSPGPAGGKGIKSQLPLLLPGTFFRAS